MIRALLLALSGGRARIGELESERRGWMDDNRVLTLRVEAAYQEIGRLNEQLDNLRKRALRPDPTPSEARMLAIVRANPGMVSTGLGRLAWQQDADEARAEHIAESGADYAHGWWNRPLVDGDTRIADAARPLSGLWKKNLVRREKRGTVYAYWAMEEE